MTEKFTKAFWGGWIRSSEGFAVRLMGHTDIQYRDRDGTLHVFAEVLAKPRKCLDLDLSTVPDTPELPRQELVDRLTRAFEFCGWMVIAE
jgi:hypothetical protein